MRDPAIQPALRQLAIRPAEFTGDGARLTLDIEMTNPTDHALRVRHADYTLECCGRTFANGFTDFASDIAPGKTVQLTVPVLVRPDAVAARCPEAADARGDHVAGSARICVHAAIADDAEVTLAASAPFTLPLPQPPTIALEAVRFDALGWNHANGYLVLTVTNRCVFDVDLATAAIHLALGPTLQLRTDRELNLALAPAGQQTVAVPIAFSPANLGYNAFAVLGESSTAYRLHVDLVADTEWGAVTFSCEHTGTAKLSSPESTADTPASNP